MHQRLHLHRTLLFTGAMSNVDRLRAMVETLPLTWRVCDPDEDMSDDDSEPYSYTFQRLASGTDPSYHVELCSETASYDYELSNIICDESGKDVSGRDEWNHLAEIYKIEVVAPAAKATPALTYRFAPAFQAPEDWYDPEACALLRKSLSGSKCPCVDWLSPKAEAWMGFLERINPELKDHYIPEPLRTWLERFSGWTKAEMETMEKSSETLLAYIQMKMVTGSDRNADQDEAASTFC